MFDFKVGVAPQRAQKRESCSPTWRPFRGLRVSNPIPLDRAQKVGPETCVTTSYVHYLLRYQGGMNLPPPPNLY